MTHSLPLFLVAEIRCAFRSGPQRRTGFAYDQFSPLRSRRFGTCTAFYAPRAQAKNGRAVQQAEQKGQSETDTPAELDAKAHSSSPTQTSQSRELIPSSKDGRAVGTRRTTDAPVRVIPKANITPSLKLSPRERLHIEMLTRRPPPVVKQQKVYKQRLLIYHHGNVSETALIFLKVLGLLCAGVVCMVVVPAHYSAGTPVWLCGTFLLAGWFPAVFFHHLLKPLVTCVHLRLPPNARASPEAAMKYAQNLPDTAQIDVSFTRISALPGTVTVHMADLKPISQASRWPWQFANVRWGGNQVDRGSRLRPNPTEFFVKPVVGAGKARRDVIPGLWSDVYDRLTGVSKEQTTRWSRS